MIKKRMRGSSMFKVGTVKYGDQDLNSIILQWAVNKINREKGFDYMTIIDNEQNTQQSNQ
jgi:hypothetical protein